MKFISIATVLSSFLISISVSAHGVGPRPARILSHLVRSLTLLKKSLVAEFNGESVRSLAKSELLGVQWVGGKADIPAELYEVMMADGCNIQVKFDAVEVPVKIIDYEVTQMLSSFCPDNSRVDAKLDVDSFDRSLSDLELILAQEPLFEEYFGHSYIDRVEKISENSFEVQSAQRCYVFAIRRQGEFIESIIAAGLCRK